MFRLIRQWLWWWRLQRLRVRDMPTVPTRWWQGAWWRGADSAAIHAWQDACQAHQDALTAYRVAWQVWNARGKPEAELPLLNAIWKEARTAMAQHELAWQARHLPEP